MLVSTDACFISILLRSRSSGICLGPHLPCFLVVWPWITCLTTVSSLRSENHPIDSTGLVSMAIGDEKYRGLALSGKPSPRGPHCGTFGVPSLAASVPLWNRNQWSLFCSKTQTHGVLCLLENWVWLLVTILPTADFLFVVSCNPAFSLRGVGCEGKHVGDC